MRAQVNAAESPAHTRTRAATHTHPACAEPRALGTVPQIFRALPAHTCTKHAHMDARTTHPLTDVYKNADSHQSLGPVPLPPPTLLGKRQNETGSSGSASQELISSSQEEKRRTKRRWAEGLSQSLALLFAITGGVWLCLWP